MSTTTLAQERSTSVSRLLPLAPGTNRIGTQRTLAEHTAVFGPMPSVDASLIDALEASGLRGRGGGWFPTARKWRAVQESARSRKGRSSVPIVVANAMEGEPASSKDAVLISHSPHLVLDGLQGAAAALGASEGVVAVHRGSPLVPVLRAAIAERRDAVPMRLAEPPARYVASEESALAHWIGDGTATPVFGTRPFDRGVDGRPTLVQNAETLAHVALIARFGAAWFAEVGEPEAPGTCLVTVGGAVERPGVLEVEIGTPVREILRRCELRPGVAGLLTGGYGGAWVEAEALLDVPWSPQSVASIGGVIGAGVLWAADPGVCPVVELARVAQYMAGESAGQCGPCRFGLPSVAEDVAALATGRLGNTAQLRSRLALVTGRGGCKHPDGTSRFLSSGLRVFAAEVDAHLLGRCTVAGGYRASALPVPPARTSPVDRGRKGFA